MLRNYSNTFTIPVTTRFAMRQRNQDLPAEPHQLVVAVPRQRRPDPDEHVEEHERLEQEPHPARHEVEEPQRLDVGKRTQPAAEEQRRRHGRHDDHVGVFGEEEQREAHAAVFGVEPARELLFGFRKVEGRAVGLGEPADEQDHERDRLDERIPDARAASCALTIPTMLSVPAVATMLTSIIVTAIS